MEMTPAFGSFEVDDNTYVHLIIFIHDSLNTKIRTAIAQDLSKSKELIKREEELQNMLKEIEDLAQRYTILEGKLIDLCMT